jgi:hypothetical protein
VSEGWRAVWDDFRKWWTSTSALRASTFAAARLRRTRRWTTFDDARVTRPANRSRERSERLAKVGGEAGIRILKTRLSNLVMTRDFWF